MTIKKTLSFLAPVVILVGTVLGVAGGPQKALAEDLCQEDGVRIDTDDKSIPETVRFLLSNSRVIEATVHVECQKHINCTLSTPLPCDFVINKAYNGFEFLRLSQADNNQPWYWGPYYYQFYIGMPSKLATEDFIYSLPYSAGEKHRIGQSYFGRYSHQKGTPEEYAVDILMPERTRILAARGGKVVAIKDNSNQGGPDAKYNHCANYVHIKHSDGTYGAYVHLMQGGAAVKVGQMVSVGSLIGYSGSTGHASLPHLHFMVYRVSNKGIYTVPFRTRTNSPVSTAGDSTTSNYASVVPQLLEGEIY